MPYLPESNPVISCKDKTISWRTDCKCENGDKRVCDRSKQPLRDPNINIISNVGIEKWTQRSLQRNVKNTGSYRDKVINGINNSEKGLLNQKFKLKLKAMEESRKPPQYRADVAQLRRQKRMYQLSSVVLNAMDANVKLVEGDELFLCNIRNASLETGKSDDRDGGIDNESFHLFTMRRRRSSETSNQFFRKSFQRSCHLSVRWITKLI